jgi:hypothetical protein
MRSIDTADPRPGRARTASNGAAASPRWGSALLATCWPANAWSPLPWLAHPELDTPERLIAAMEAGEAVGGDRRGRQSAAMKLVTTEDFPDVDLRIDDHSDPLAELRRLLELWRRYRAPGLAGSPSRANPSGFIDMDAIEADWVARGIDLRFRRWRRERG